METFSALLAICVGNSPVTCEFSSQSQCRGALMFSLICSWINCSVKNREAGDLRHHRGHYNVTVMHPRGAARVSRTMILTSDLFVGEYSGFVPEAFKLYCVRKADGIFTNFLFLKASISLWWTLLLNRHEAATWISDMNQWRPRFPMLY